MPVKHLPDLRESYRAAYRRALWRRFVSMAIDALLLLGVIASIVVLVEYV